MKCQIALAYVATIQRRNQRQSAVAGVCRNEKHICARSGVPIATNPYVLPMRLRLSYTTKSEVSSLHSVVNAGVLATEQWHCELLDGQLVFYFLIPLSLQPILFVLLPSVEYSRLENGANHCKFVGRRQFGDPEG